jgi:hypothetical protein
MDVLTSWPPTSLASRCSCRSMPNRSGQPTAPGSSFDAHATEFFRDWYRVVNDTVALLHAEAGLSDLIGELSTRSDQFRGRWAAHDVQIHTTCVKLIHRPVVGDLDLSFWRHSATSTDRMVARLRRGPDRYERRVATSRLDDAPRLQVRRPGDRYLRYAPLTASRSLRIVVTTSPQVAVEVMTKWLDQ